MVTLAPLPRGGESPSEVQELAERTARPGLLGSVGREVGLEIFVTRDLQVKLGRQGREAGKGGREGGDMNVLF